MKKSWWMVLAGVLACNASPKITTDAPTTPSVAASVPIASPAPAPVLLTKPKIVEAPADSDALSLIRTERLLAKTENRVLVVYVGATWCDPCKKFKAELASGRLDARLAKIELLTFDVDKDGDRLRAAGYTFQFVPFVALPGADGSPADTQQATGKGGDAWRELLGKLDSWQS